MKTNSPRKNILITGRPRVGKTTLIKHCADILAAKAGGFYTEEILGEGIRGRKGFQLMTLAGLKSVLAEVDFASDYSVGRYGVHLDVMEKIAVPAILNAIQHKDWVLIDEIGKMEEGSLPFRNAVVQALDSNKRVLEPVQNLARLSEKALIFENRSAAYIEVCEQRIAENQGFFAKIVEILNRLLANIRWNDSEFTRRIKCRNDVTLIKLTIPTREQIYQIMNEYLLSEI